MRAVLDLLPEADRRSVKKCSDCRTHDSTVFLCGWHENLLAATRAVQAVVDQERKQ